MGAKKLAISARKQSELDDALAALSAKNIEVLTRTTSVMPVQAPLKAS